MAQHTQHTISVIISVYKNTQALRVVLDSLLHQTLPPDEIIISEDGESEVMCRFVATQIDPRIRHITQKDEGWRKNKALNNAIKSATSEYLIFIDGDVVPHPRFVESHLSQAKKRRVCAGKRAELGNGFSQKLIDGELSIEKLAKNYIWWAVSLHKDGVRHYEDGIFIPYESFLYTHFIRKKTISYLIGCNFSCFKEDIVAINGFDERYIHPAIGEDVDINWRFRASGTEVISVRNIANVYHLWHKKGFGATEGEINNKILQDTIDNNRFVCQDGIKKLQGEQQ